ncbi:MAG: AEC family transporter [Treponemataceae bacterium]|nr:AEC family transporter [Spirochaetales bacterium]MDY6030663.1 AEC family transporter [Treponemataceae bacterium]
MLQNFLSVFQQVCILCILIAVGFLCGKLKFFTKESIKHLSTFVLYFVTPCVIINSFNRDFEKEMFKGLMITFAAAIGAHLLNIILAHLVMHDKDESREKVLRFGVVFSNCGYMALPLQQAVLGNEGVFYSAAFIGIFNIMTWTYGVLMMSSSCKVKPKSKLPPAAELQQAEQPRTDSRKVGTYIRKAFLNPGVVGVALGLIVFFLPITLPKIVASPIASLAALNTPLPMVIIGFYLSEITSFAVLKNANFWLALVMRLVIAPVISIVIFYFCGIREVVLCALAISVCTPSAANTVMFATIFERDTILGSELVSISTLFSIITMPVIISFVMSLG